MRVAASNIAQLFCCTLVALFLAGCISTDPEILRTDSPRTYSFQTKVDYQTVYQRSSEGFLRCLTGAQFQMTYVIRPRIDSAGKTASILLVFHGAWTDYRALVDIVGTAGVTNVRVNTSVLSWATLKDLGETVERWTNGSQHCPPADHLTRRIPLLE